MIQKKSLCVKNYTLVSIDEKYLRFMHGNSDFIVLIDFDFNWYKNNFTYKINFTKHLAGKGRCFAGKGRCFAGKGRCFAGKGRCFAGKGRCFAGQFIYLLKK